MGNVLALIPARGGSKSVPRKNLLNLAGKPMIAWSIENALAAKHISRIIVTTDDYEIAAVAKEFGAEVPFLRPPELAGDLSTDIDYHRHAIEWLYQNEDYIPDMVVNLRPTPPARNPKVIDRAVEIFASHPEADSLRSVHLSKQSPFKMWTISEIGWMQPVAPLPDFREPYNQPRQCLPLVYWQDGYIDITRPSVILNKNSTTGDKILPFIIEEIATDIDYPDEIEQVMLELENRFLKSGQKSFDLSSKRFPS
ncbi:MAG: acylneuraminate cytidylyltransferase family protein [Bacteroidetes bacterium]|nr:acylneuraminate cytidylyltransferase family protein [Bacteroidota bacterium]